MGALINTDLYIEVPAASGQGKKTIRAKLPQSALQWLFDALQKQGSSAESMSGLSGHSRNEVLSGVQGAAAQIGAPAEGQQQQGQQGLLAS